MINVYKRSINSKNIIILYGDRKSFRCRQRSKLSNGLKVKPMNFVSFKDMEKVKNRDKNRIIGPLNFYSISKL